MTISATFFNFIQILTLFRRFGTISAIKPLYLFILSRYAAIQAHFDPLEPIQARGEPLRASRALKIGVCDWRSKVPQMAKEAHYEPLEGDQRPFWVLISKKRPFLIPSYFLP